jgi:branched-chain amino acid transport system substrate-binding protein
VRRACARGWLAAVVLGGSLSGCDAGTPCPTIVYAAGTLHSVSVAVAESLEAEHPAVGVRRVCYRLEAQPSYDLIDQPDAEVALAERIAADPTVVAVVGHLRSRGSLAAAPVYARYGVPQIVPGATSHLLRSAGPWTFVLAPTDAEQAAFLAAQAAAMRLRRVVVFYSGEPYGEGLNEAVHPMLASRRIAIEDEVRLGVGADAATLAEASTRARAVDGVIVLGDYSQAATIAATVVARRPRLKLLASDGAMYPNGLRRQGGAAAESLYVVSVWHPDTADSATRRFIARFEQVAGREATPGEALGADALLFARAALDAVGPDRSAIRAWLAGPDGARPPPGHVTGATLHDGPPSTFQLIRIGPPPVSSP